MTALATIRTDYLGTRQRISPGCLFYLLQIKLESIGNGKRIINLIRIERHSISYSTLFLARYLLVSLSISSYRRILATDNRSDDTGTMLAELHGLAAQLMRFQLYESFRIQPTAIHHDREVTISFTLLRAYNGNRLSGIHMLSNLNQVLGIVGINGFQTAIVAHHDDITH